MDSQPIGNEDNAADDVSFNGPDADCWGRGRCATARWIGSPTRPYLVLTRKPAKDAPEPTDEEDEEDADDLALEQQTFRCAVPTNRALRRPTTATTVGWRIAAQDLTVDSSG